jgi:hypothetical protein
MITEEVLATYRRMGGNLDGLGRWVPHQAGDLEQGLAELDHLLQQAVIVTRGLADEEFAERIRREVERVSASPAIAAQIWEAAR